MRRSLGLGGGGPAGAAVKTNSAGEEVVNTVVSNGLIAYHWASVDATGAPTATDLADYTIGLASDGAAAGVVYHVIDGAWVSTGATVANLYGG